jgi:hypothetical protein
MRHWKIWLYLVGMIAILGSCIFVSLPGGSIVPRTPTQAEAAPQTDIRAEKAVPVAEVAIEPTAEEKETPTEAPVETEIAVVNQVDQCVECHTDKEQLINTAAPEEEHVEESEGAG